MGTDEDQDRPTIPSNTALAALAADVGGMVETAIAVTANLGRQVMTLFPQLPESAEAERRDLPRPPAADHDGYILALDLRRFYVLAVQRRIATELNGADTIGDMSSEADEQPAPHSHGPGRADDLPPF